MSIWDDTRADWGATSTSGMAFVAANRRDEFFNHYDGANPLGLANQPHSACLAKVKADQRFHMGPSRGWSDIGYNGLICQHGRAIEGRGLDYAGAHCPDHNTRGYGIQFQVGGNEAPTQAAKDRMRRLYDDLCKRSGRKLAMKGHRDGLATLCPGDIVYSWVKAGMPSSGAAAATTTGAATTYTREDVARLQRVLGLEDDGLWGAATEKQAQAIRRCLKPGMKRSEWDRLRYWRLRMSRPAGKQTSDSMRRAHQWALKVEVDGIWGEATDAAWRAMREQHKR